MGATQVGPHIISAAFCAAIDELGISAEWLPQPARRPSHPARRFKGVPKARGWR